MGLVITMNKNERVFIGEDICVSELTKKNGKHRILIEAPEDVRIKRESHVIKVGAFVRYGAERVFVRVIEGRRAIVDGGHHFNHEVDMGELFIWCEDE